MHAYTYDKYNIYIYLSISHIYFFITCFISYHISYTFRVILHFTYYSCNHILSSHSSVMLLISCHISYTSHLRILVICFYVSYLHKPRSGYGKDLYVPEGTITVRDSDLYLYDQNGAVIMIKTGSMSSTQMGPRYL